MVCVHCTRKPVLRSASAERASRCVAHEKIEKIFVSFGYAGDRAGQPVGSHENARGSGDGSVSYDWTYGGNFAARAAQSVANAGHGENRADAGDGIAGSDENRVGGHDGFDHSGRGFGVGRAGEAH